MNPCLTVDYIHILSDMITITVAVFLYVLNLLYIGVRFNKLRFTRLVQIEHESYFIICHCCMLYFLCTTVIRTVRYSSHVCGGVLSSRHLFSFFLCFTIDDKYFNSKLYIYDFSWTLCTLLYYYIIYTVRIDTVTGLLWFFGQTKTMGRCFMSGLYYIVIFCWMGKWLPNFFPILF